MKPIFVIVFLVDTTLSSTLRDDSCSRLEKEFSTSDTLSETLHPPPVLGTWVSQRCEVRPGPKFLLRKVEFLSNQTFRLTEFHYADESCSVPLYSTAASGAAPPASSWSLHRLTMTAYSAEVAEELSSKLNSSCPVRRRWRLYRENVLLTMVPEWRSFTDNLSPPPPTPGGRNRNIVGVKMIGRHPLSLLSSDCMTLLQDEFPQMDPVMIHSRPADPLYPHPRLEMILGGSDSQTPLLRSNQTDGCEICVAVARGWSRSPPQLLSQPRLPPLLSVEWISPRCERGSSGVHHVRRRLNIHGRYWLAGNRYFGDASCSRPSFTTSTSGFFIPLSPSSRVPGATDVDFHRESATLTLHDQRLVNSLRRDRKCGLDPIWQVGTPVDLTHWQGARCRALGDVMVPQVEWQIVRVEISPRGTPLLLLGQANLAASAASWRPLRRPTAYQPPLVQCEGELPPLTLLLDPQTSDSTTTGIEHYLWTIYIGVLVLR